MVNPGYGIRISAEFLSLCWGTVWGNAFALLNGCRLTGLLKCFGVPQIGNGRRGRITFGKKVILRSSAVSNVAGCFHPVMLATRGEGVLTIGDGVGISSSVIVAENRVTIGDRVQIGVNCAIYDTDFHAIDPVRRLDKVSQKTAPVVLEDDVWLGANVIVLKGVRIGRGSVIGAGSLVVRDVPPGVLATGNPAKVLKQIIP